MHTVKDPILDQLELYYKILIMRAEYTYDQSIRAFKMLIMACYLSLVSNKVCLLLLLSLRVMSLKRTLVLEFFRELIRDAPVPPEQLAIGADQHARHQEKLVTEFLRQNNVTILFLPPYSSVMNPQERVWAIFKRQW